MVSWLNRVRPSTSVFLFTLFIFAFAASSPVTNRFKRDTGKKSPVILVPGDGGSQLEARLDKPETVHYYCNKKTDDYFSLWLNLELLFPYVLDCWVDNMRLVYDNVTRTTKNSPGVDIRVPGFGNTTHVEWLDPSEISPSSYFKSIVDALVAIGYSRGVNVKGAPYDYRKAPNEMADYYRSIKNMTVDLYNKNQNTPVTFICHSMGCPVMLYFLNHQTQEWKNTYVKSLLTLGGAWGGAVKALKAYASGENLGVYVINHLAVRTEQRTCPSLAYMVPFDTFWNKTEVLVQTHEKNYTLGDLYDFFHDIGFPDGWNMYKDTYNLTRSLTPPGVEIHCIHGIQEQTIERLVYEKGGFPDSNPAVVYGDGDGTVNLRSLQGCLRFQGHQEQKVYYTTLPSIDHMGILSDKKVLEYVQHVVQTF